MVFLSDQILKDKKAVECCHSFQYFETPGSFVCDHASRWLSGEGVAVRHTRLPLLSLIPSLYPFPLSLPSSIPLFLHTAPAQHV